MAQQYQNLGNRIHRLGEKVRIAIKQLVNAGSMLPPCKRTSQEFFQMAEVLHSKFFTGRPSQEVLCKKIFTGQEVLGKVFVARSSLREDARSF